MIFVCLPDNRLFSSALEQCLATSFPHQVTSVQSISEILTFKATGSLIIIDANLWVQPEAIRLRPELRKALRPRYLRVFEHAGLLKTENLLMNHGYKAAVSCDDDISTILQGVTAALNDMLFISPNRRMKPKNDLLCSLSDREREVVSLITYKKAEIGRALGLSHSTVSSYIRRACEKLGITDETELRHYMSSKQLLRSLQ